MHQSINLVFLVYRLYVLIHSYPLSLCFVCSLTHPSPQPSTPLSLTPDRWEDEEVGGSLINNANIVLV